MTRQRRKAGRQASNAAAIATRTTPTEHHQFGIPSRPTPAARLAAIRTAAQRKEPMTDQRIIAAIAAMTEAELEDTLRAARGDDNEAKKQAAADALRRVNKTL